MRIYADPDFRYDATIEILEDADYERALRAFVIVCADVVLTDEDRSVVYLAERAVEPMKGWWWMGGRVRRGEMYEHAATRKLFQETGLQVAEQRLRYVELVRHLLPVRKQTPQDAGSDVECHTYAVALTPLEVEVVNAHLDATEYRPGSLTAFDRNDLERPDIRQVTRDICRRILA